MKKTVLALTCAVLCAAPALAEEAKKPYRSTDDIIASAPADAWRSVDPANLLYMQLDKGTVIYELAPDFAPEHVAQIRMLAQKHFWDGLSIYRVQDNYVTLRRPQRRYRQTKTVARRDQTPARRI